METFVEFTGDLDRVCLAHRLLQIVHQPIFFVFGIGNC